MKQGTEEGLQQDELILHEYSQIEHVSSIYIRLTKNQK